MHTCVPARSSVQCIVCFIGFVLTRSNTVLSSLADKGSFASISNCNGKDNFKDCDIQPIATSCRKSVAGVFCLPGEHTIMLCELDIMILVLFTSS